MTEQPLDGIAIMRDFVPSSPFVGHVGIRLESIEADHARLMLPFGEQVVTVGRVVHGGAISALIDTAAMVAAWAGAEVPANLRGTTVGLTVTFLAAATATDLTADARVLRRGRSLCYVEVDVTDASGGAVAKGLVTYKVG